MSRAIAENLDRLDHRLLQHRPRYHSALLPGATPAELHLAETNLGLRLPEDLRTLLTWHNGQRDDFAGAFEASWQLMSADHIVAAKLELDADSEQTGWQPAWVPFLDDDQGDYLCLDTGQAAAPVRGFWPPKTEHPIIAPSLAAWLEEFVSAVERGEYVEDPERGAFLRKS
jgi:cell wall assembly regulator SMI1